MFLDFNPNRIQLLTCSSFTHLQRTYLFCIYKNYPLTNCLPFPVYLFAIASFPPGLWYPVK